MSLYIFDKDDTLIGKVPVVPKVPLVRKVVRRSAVKPEDQKLLPGVREKLDQLRAEGHILAIATNQPNVARGILTLAEAHALAEDCAAKAGGVSAWRVCPYDPKAAKKRHREVNPYARDDETRKPHPGMIVALMDQLGYTPADTVMVGDTKLDRKAAEAAGVKFISAKRFFKYKKHK